MQVDFDLGRVASISRSLRTQVFSCAGCSVLFLTFEKSVLVLLLSFAVVYLIHRPESKGDDHPRKGSMKLAAVSTYGDRPSKAVRGRATSDTR